MEIDQDKHPDPPAPGTDAAPVERFRTLLKPLLNVLIVGMLAAAGYFAYTLLSKSPDIPKKTGQSPAAVKVIQLDVLNGCGVKGAGVRFTSFLRTSGFDVVEMKNYKTFSVAQTLVVDRIGDLSIARRVAAALGVAEKNVIQQINPDYFVDVSVIIGGDYASLRVGH